MKSNPSLIPRFYFDYNIKDFLIGIKAVLSKENYDFSFLESEFFSKSLYFTNYGRSALYILLKSLELPKGAKVGVPLYTCTVVLEAIKKADLEPRFIDIDSNYTMDPEDLKKKVNEIDALIVIHTFGRPANMDVIIDIAQKIPILEDCAHSLFSEYKSRRTGSIGNAGILSLPKYLSSGGGGMIILNDENIKEKVYSNIQSIDKNTLIDEIKHLFVAYLRSFFYQRPWFGLISFPIGSSIEKHVDLMNKKSFKVKCINKSDLAIFRNKIHSFAIKVDKQRQNSFFLLESLKETSLTLPTNSKESYWNYYLFPVLVRDKDKRDHLCDYLRERGIDTSTLFSNTPEVARLQYGYENDCPFTEDVCKRILTIPNHAVLNKQELNKIVETIKSCPFLES